MSKVDLRDLSPGDLIGFCDRGPLGVGINLATWGIPGWGLSHVAIVGGYGPLLFESTTLADAPCAVTGKFTDGVQAHFPNARLARFRGRVWRYPLADQLRCGQRLQLREFCCHHTRQRTSYDALGAFRSRSTPLGIVERLFLQSPENLSRLFCSEFVAAALKACGVWNAPNASRWNPNSLVRALSRAGIIEPRRRIRTELTRINGNGATAS